MSGHFIVDVMLYLMNQIKYYSSVEIKLKDEITHQLYGEEPKETLGRFLCQFFITTLPKDEYGISRSTKYRRLKELEQAGIIEVDPFGKCWIPTREFYSEIAKLLK